MLKQKKQGTKDFPQIDAFTSIIDDKLVIQCNYCSFNSEKEIDMYHHYENEHKDIATETYPKKYLNIYTGKIWYAPKLETIEDSIYQIDSQNFYIKFNGFCTYDEIPLTENDLAHIKQDPKTNNFYFDTTLPKPTTHTEKPTKPTTQQPKEPKQPKRPRDKKLQKKPYLLNIKDSNVEKTKKRIIDNFGVLESDFVIKKNKYGNNSIFFYK